MGNNKRVILITGAGGNLLKYNKPREELKKYSTIHGFDFEFLEYCSDYKLMKLYQIQKMLCDMYNYVIWVDYDIRVLNYAPNILNYLGDNNSSVWVASHLIESGNKWKNVLNRFRTYRAENTGVMVFKVNNESARLINDMIQLVKVYYKDFDIVDNGAFLNLIGKCGLLKKLFFKHLYKDYGKYNVDSFPNNFNYVRGKNFYVDPDIPLVFEHFAGVEKRDEYLK